MVTLALKLVLVLNVSGSVGSFYVLALDSFSRLRSPLGRLGGGPTVPNKVLTVGDIGGVPYHARTSDRTHEAYL